MMGVSSLPEVPRVIFIHKMSPQPLQPWDHVNQAGRNTVVRHVHERYLLLREVQVAQRGGMWHYVFAFDSRDSLELSPLARMLGGKDAHVDSVDWQSWLGDNWRLIESHALPAILNGSDDASPQARITDLRVR